MTQPQLKLLCVFAHPDDETLGSGGTLARYAAEGIETYVITATRGQRGWLGDADDFPGLIQFGDIREQELRAAAKALNLTEIILLDYCDGELDQADSVRMMHELTVHIRRIRPQVVVTFDPFGAYGHPDHITISQQTASSVACAADAQYFVEEDDPPFAVSKLYYLVTTQVVFDLYQQVLEIW